MPKITLKLSQKALILVAIPLIFEVGFIAILYTNLVQAEQQVQREIKAKEIVLCYNKLNFATTAVSRNLLLLCVMGNREAYKDYLEARASIPAQFDHLKQLLADNPVEYNRIVRLQAIAHKCEEGYDSILRRAQEGDRLMLFVEQKRLAPTLSSYTKEIDAIRMDTEERESKLPSQQQHKRETLRKLLISGVLLNIILAVFLVYLFNRNTTRRLSVLMDNTRRLAAGKPLNPPLPGSDEIAELDKVFNEMAIVISDATEKERAVVDYAQEVICSLDENGSFTKVNRAAITVWGYEPDDLIGTSLFNLLSNEDRHTTESAINTLKTTSPSLVFENQIKTRSGNLADTLWSARWSEIDRSIFCVAHDMTDRKQMERLKQEFYSMVTHDLRTPLSSIYAILVLICAKALGPVSEPVEARLNTAKKNVERLIGLINDLLDLDKLEAGKMPIERSKVNAGEIINRSIQAVETYAEQQHITLSYDNSTCELEADGERLIQVLVNLISNAVKFSPEKSTVKISTVKTKDWLEFRVTDNGRGIPETYQKAIFERFQQVQASDARRNVGTGLGLNVCKMIVENHGGEIGVQSEENKGSTFWFRIPLVSAAAVMPTQLK
jgi:PAS domain S-box-containing protein